jgi:hypothetical protein
LLLFWPLVVEATLIQNHARTMEMGENIRFGLARAGLTESVMVGGIMLVLTVWCLWAADNMDEEWQKQARTLDLIRAFLGSPVGTECPACGRSGESSSVRVD